MTGVLLVDDEPLVLVGIQSMLKWEDYGAQVVGTARNGAQAMELIQTLRPDLVIADIKMPVMDGLKLMETAQDTIQDPPLFILLTSFEEFAFVKAAINRQAVDYLVKLELTQQTLLGALRKAQERLAARRHAEPVRRPPTERFGMQPFYDRFFIRLFNSLFENEEQMRAQQQELGVDFSFDAYAVCYCELPDLTAQSMGQERLMNLYSSTTRMAWETATRFMACYITPLDPRHFNITFCLSEQEAPIYQEAVGNVLEKVVEVAYNYFSVRLLCSVGCKVGPPMELSRSYYTARLRLTERGPQDGAVAFFEGDAEDTEADSVFDMALYREALTRAFEDQDAGALDQIMGRIGDSIRAWPSRRLQAMDAACNLLFLCLSQFTNGEELVSQIFEREPEGYRCLYRRRSSQDIADWLDTLRAGLVQSLRSQRRGYKDQIIRQIKAYIQANLGQRLTLNNAAAVFGFSPNYLSQLFARQAGCSFVEYVNGEKIRAAKEMMREENVKFYEIAERLGFENAFYFSKVFKKIEGCSPREYVQKLKQD